MVSLPHGVQQCAFLCNSQQFVWHGHVVSHRLLAIVEEGIGGPDLAGHQVVKTQHGHWAFKFQPFILPALSEEHINGVLLKVDGES